VAFRCRAIGAAEDTTVTFLTACHQRGIRRLRAYVDGISDHDLLTYLAEAKRVDDLARGSHRRGDLIRVRTIARWPWRTRSDQRHGGVVGDA